MRYFDHSNSFKRLRFIPSEGTSNDILRDYKQHHEGTTNNIMRKQQTAFTKKTINNSSIFIQVDIFLLPLHIIYNTRAHEDDAYILRTRVKPNKIYSTVEHK